MRQPAAAREIEDRFVAATLDHLAELSHVDIRQLVDRITADAARHSFRQTLRLRSLLMGR